MLIAPGTIGDITIGDEAAEEPTRALSVHHFAPATITPRL